MGGKHLCWWGLWGDSEPGPFSLSTGRRILRRTYRFEFTETGNSRREGEITMLGEQVKSVTMEPYEILE